MVTDRDHIVYAFDGRGNLSWQLAEPLGALAGRPLQLDDTFIFATSDGQVVVAVNGAVQARQQYDEPFGSGPIAFRGDNLLIAGWDGTLYVVGIPQ